MRAVAVALTFLAVVGAPSANAQEKKGLHPRLVSRILDEIADATGDTDPSDQTLDVAAMGPTFKQAGEGVARRAAAAAKGAALLKSYTDNGQLLVTAFRCGSKRSARELVVCIRALNEAKDQRLDQERILVDAAVYSDSFPVQAHAGFGIRRTLQLPNAERKTDAETRVFAIGPHALEVSSMGAMSPKALDDLVTRILVGAFGAPGASASGLIPSPATPQQTRYGAALSDALRLRFFSVEAIDDYRQLYSATGRRHAYKGLSLTHYTFETPEAAAAFRRRPAPKTIVEPVSGKPKAIYLLEGEKLSEYGERALEALRRGGPQVLPRALGVDAVTPTVVDTLLEGSSTTISAKGVQVALDGLNVTRLLFSTEELARRRVESGDKATEGRDVVDRHGPSVVSLEGPGLAKPGFAGKALRAAWLRGIGQPGPRTEIVVRDGPDAFAILIFNSAGRLYAQTVKQLKKARKEKATADGSRFRFRDELRNKLQLQSANAAYEAQLLSKGALIVLGPNPKALKELRGYLLALLRTLHQKPPPIAEATVGAPKPKAVVIAEAPPVAVDAELSPLSATERKTLQKVLGGKAWVHETKHFALVSTADRVYTRERGKLLERARSGFYNFYAKKGFTLHGHPKRLEAVVFRSQPDFQAYVKKNYPGLEQAGGLYAGDTNRLYLFDYRRSPELKEAQRKQQEYKRNIEDARAKRKLAERRKEHQYARELSTWILKSKRALRAWERANARWLELAGDTTAIHEAVHQLCYNSGLLEFSLLNPVWLVEGLAMLFEDPNVWKGRYSKERNAGRILSLSYALEEKRSIPLRTIVSQTGTFFTLPDPELAYATAWALTHMFVRGKFRKYKDRFFAYLKLVRAQGKSKTAAADAAKIRLETFRSSFGDIDRLDRELREQIKKLVGK
jgi:hypothetical protein